MSAGTERDVNDGAFRSARVYGRCARCDEQTAEVRCLRCGLPYCPTHAPQNDLTRCTDCEAHYLKLRADRQKTPIRGWMVVLSVCAIPLVVLAPFIFADAADLPKGAMRTGYEVVSISLGIIAAMVSLVLAIVLRRQGRLRQRFLAERPGGHHLSLSAASTTEEGQRTSETPAKEEPGLNGRIAILFGAGVLSFIVPFGSLLVFVFAPILFREDWRRLQPKDRSMVKAALVMALLSFALHLVFFTNQ